MNASTDAVRRRRVFFAVGWSVVVLGIAVPPLVVGPAFVRSGAMLVPGLMAVFGPATLLEAVIARPKSVRVAGGTARARSWTGERAVDLHDLATVRAWEGMARGAQPVFVSLVDRSAGRMILRVDDQVRHLIADAVRRHGAGYVSPWATELLGLKPTRWYVAGARVLGLSLAVLALLAGGMLVAAALARR
ncbi:hypothetical protein ACFV4G_28855 [Kitasatospora sp. NPDC059747]|uniref:hypothetical protein n=1 Tax=Kitasatospora sp. NPDC059747 TaxID=3346930 RepID=UPI003664D452